MRKALYIFIYMVISFAPRAAYAEPFSRLSDSKYSILGSDKESFFATLISSPADSVTPFVSTPTAVATAYEISLPTTTPQGVAGTEFLEFLDTNKNVYYSKDRWQQMRHTQESGVSQEPTVAVSTITRPAPLPLPPGLSVELPYESQLFISGRKLIGVTMKSTIYDQPEIGTRVNSSSFDMKQELQVRIKGRVGRKINVNVDFDDTVADKRDISVVYKGDPNEFVQEAAFGDIVMSLPSTEFVGYSRQLFGVKLDTRYKSLHTQGFFSRTKGLSEVKRFTGNTQFNRVTIADTSFISLKYYATNAGVDAIKAGTVKIYQDDIRNDNNSKIVISTATSLSSLLPNPGFSYAGNFDLLVAGQDYTVDYHTGNIVFRNRLGSDWAVAIDYQKNDGTWLSSGGAVPGNPLLIKDRNNVSTANAALGITNPLGVSTELKTFYSLGNIKIVRDNGRGNFILRIEDLNAAVPATLMPGNKAVPTYPSNVVVDFENGIFNFDPASAKPLPDDLYSSNTHRYNIVSEYRYRIKIINLRPGIVPQSERVTVNARVLKANEDYFIDYDAGILTLYNEDRIDENTVIDVSYDYAPFGGSSGSTLVGMRSELSLTKDIFVGSSFVYDFAAQGQTVPDIRSTPSSLLVGEVDSRATNIKIPLSSVTMSVSGEYARSEQNPNIMDKAMVESMEGIKQEDGISMLTEQWRYAPTGPNVPFYATDLTWVSQEVSKSEISPSLVYQTDDKQQILNINYNLLHSNEVSLVQTLSTSGLDFSKKLYLETWINGDGKGEEISVSYGTFNERFSNNTGLESEDLNYNRTLDSGEDIGWDFVNPDGSITKIGAGNGKLDSEDFNANGQIDTVELPAAGCPYGPANTDGKSILDANGVAHTSVDWSGWKFFRIPLNIAVPDDWKNIREVRVTIRGASQQKGSISIAGLSMVGNRWLADTANAVTGSSLTITAINTDNSDYVSLANNYYYQQLYKTQTTTTKAKEQALSLKYNVVGTTTTQLGAVLVYSGRPYDFSSYGNLKFFVYCKQAQGDTFFLQAGGSDLNYYEYSMPIPAEWVNTWQLITIRQVGSANKADHWVSDDPRATIKLVGTPNLANISQLKIGVRAVGPKTGEVWVNEIHVSDAMKKSGEAWRASMDLLWPGAGRVGAITAGGSRKEINRNFQTFAAGVYNRDLLEDSGQLGFKGLNLGGITWVPFTARMMRSRTITPSVVQNQNDLLSVLDEGRVTSYTGAADSSLSLGKWFPQMGGTYQRSIIDSQQISRLEDRETLLGNFSYATPARVFFLPTSVTGSYSQTNSYYRVYPSTKIIDTDAFLDPLAAQKYLQITDYHTLEITDSFALKTPFQLWNGFLFSPSYNINKVKEKNKDFTVAREYPKSASQDVGATSSLTIFKWLQPSVNYSINTRENYNLTMSTDPVNPVYPSQRKYIERNAAGELAWNFQVKDIFNYAYTQSLGFSSSFRIQDSDSYDNVDSSVTAAIPSMDKLIVRDNPLLAIPTPGTTTYYLVKSVVQKNDIRISGRYNPFEALGLYGRLSPLRTVTTNFTYSGSDEHSYITGTKRDVYTRVWPDLLIGLSQSEKMLYLDRWLSDSQINFRLQQKSVDTLLIAHSETKSYGGDWRFNLVRKLDLNFTVNTAHTRDFDIVLNRLTQEGDDISWSSQSGFTSGKWRFMVRYENAQTWRVDGLGALTTQLFTNTYTGQVNTDMSFPRGIPIPFTRRTLPLTNRFIFTTTLKYLTHNSSLNIERDNNVNYAIASTADYEVSQNFRMSLGLGWNRFEYRDNPKTNYTALEATGKLTIQF
ncbi:MAG: hypothetical protein NTU66_02925 [Elusimicrobia bacterium]|nr:hypothetical protein [Elusimicrobiota bacterium]